MKVLKSATSWSSAQQASATLHRPIFILGPHKSGSSLLRNLFDGHSQLQTIPVETHFFQLMSYWVEYAYRQQWPSDVEVDTVIQRMRDQVHHFNVRDNRLGDADLKGRFDTAHFARVMAMGQATASPAALITRYLDALYQSVANQELSSSKRVVHKTVGMAEFALDLWHLFPSARFVHIIRNPYANLVSWRKFYTSRGPYPLLNRMIASMRSNYYHMTRNQRLIPGYQVVRYEDLIEDSQAVMQRLAEGLELPFEPTLLHPTQLGDTWQGNSTLQQPLSGISRQPSQRWREDILPWEVCLINQSFPFILRQYDYERVEASGSWLRPGPREGLSRYVYNRLFRAYNRSYSHYE